MAAKDTAAFMARLEDYLFIGGNGITPRFAAQRLGLCERTIRRYRKWLREQATT